MMSSSLIVPLEIAKWVFVVVYVCATIGVIIGVYWEGDQFPKEKQQRGWRLLVGSLAIDTLFTIMIFGTDGWVSAIQRDEIVALEMRLAARTLSDEQVSRFKTKLAPFAGQKFGAITYWGVQEPAEFILRLGNDVLIPSGWEFVKGPVGQTLVGVMAGVVVVASPQADERVKLAGATLVAALLNEGIAARLVPDETAKDQLSVQVGIKP